MNCLYFLIVMDSVFDLYACLRSCIGDSHATVVAACRSQDFQGLQDKRAALGFC
jgi:hypothetical protein